MTAVLLQTKSKRSLNTPQSRYLVFKNYTIPVVKQLNAHVQRLDYVALRKPEDVLNLKSLGLVRSSCKYKRICLIIFLE